MHAEHRCLHCSNTSEICKAPVGSHKVLKLVTLISEQKGRHESSPRLTLILALCSHFLEQLWKFRTQSVIHEHQNIGDASECPAVRSAARWGCVTTTWNRSGARRHWTRSDYISYTLNWKWQKKRRQQAERNRTDLVGEAAHCARSGRHRGELQKGPLLLCCLRQAHYQRRRIPLLNCK